LRQVLEVPGVAGGAPPPDPLPSFRLVQQSGWALLPRFRTDLPGEAAVADLGVSWRGSRVHRVTPRQDGTPNTYSGRHGWGAFPFHTDLAHHGSPPRYIVLRCVCGHPEVRTPLIDGEKMVQAIGPDLLARAVVQPRRPSAGRMRLLRLLERGEPDRLRWDEEYIRPASAAGAEAVEAVRTALVLAAPLEVTLAEPGDTLIIDNWRVLHARSPVPPAAADRLIERAYLEELL
jgi:L-asparagine oxygenase